ncbi:hypothetical protein MCEORH2_01263 [Methylophilaceae bacterium]
MNKIIKIINYLAGLLDGSFIDFKSQKFIKYCFKRWSRIDDEPRESIVLVELYGVHQTVLAFSYFANILAEKHQSKILSFSLSYRSKLIYYLRNRKMIEIYKSFNVKSHLNMNITARQLNRALYTVEDILLGIKSKHDVLNILIDGNLVGNEIYEAYLKEHSKPTIDIFSIEFRNFLLECVKTYVFWYDYFNKNDVKGVVLSHGIYRYGIIKTIANRKGIPVYLPTVRSLYCLNKPDEWGIPRYDLYHEQFQLLSHEARLNGLDWAKERLSLRLSGKVGVDMSYSTKSAFNPNFFSNNVLRKSNRIKVLITTHCFFDNPNCYGRNLFPDFYEWISFLGEISEITNYDWYLKSHPDLMPGNDEVLSELLNKYKNITRLPSETSHLQLVDEGISFVLTVYGSVGHEYPLLGTTVINAGNKNPHVGYDFNIHANNIKEYRNYLLNLEKIKHKADIEKIYEFYFMHHKICGVIENFFFKSFDNFLSTISAKDQNSSIAYEYYLNEITQESDELICHKIEKFIESGDYRLY